MSHPSKYLSMCTPRPLWCSISRLNGTRIAKSGRVSLRWFEQLPLRVIELGASSPMKESEQALAMLMENTLGKTFPVVRSAVPVRP
jgi:hypothetical protein